MKLAFNTALLLAAAASTTAEATAAATTTAENEKFEVLSLTPDNYEEVTEGKTVFLKFFSPKCPHCVRMKQDWEKLAEEWNNHEIGLVAEVDCSAEGRPLCDANGIRGFPTMKWGDPSSLEDYNGGRSFDDLDAFAKEHLKPVCSPANVDLCEGEKKKQIDNFMQLGTDELEDKIKAEEEKVEKAENTFKEAVEKLQAEFQKLSKEKEKTIDEVKEGGLGLLKAVRAFKAKKESTGSDEL